MSLADALNAGPVNPVRVNLIAKYLDQMDDADREATLAALRNPDWSDRQLARTLRAAGYDLGPGTVQKWRIDNGVR